MSAKTPPDAEAAAETGMPASADPADALRLECAALQATLAESEARFERLSTLTSHWLWEQDRAFRFTSLRGPQGGQPLGSVSVLGLTRWERAGASADQSPWRQHREQLERHETFDVFEYQALSADGELRVYNVSGAPAFAADGEFVGYQGFGCDVTELRRAEARLRDSEARFRNFAEMGSDWYWEQDHEFRFIELSAGLSKQGELAPHVHIGKTRWEIESVDMDEATWQAHRELLKRHEPFRDFQVLRPGVDGQVRVSAISGDPVFDTEGRFSGYRGVGSDITARVRATQAQHALEAQLRESQKMESIGTLAGGIAHDFNNILGALLGNLALARNEIGPQHPAQQSLRQIHSSTLRARSLVRQILTFSRRQPPEMTCQPVRPVIEETITMLRATLPASVAFELELADSPIRVQADTTQLQQVLLNLCTNAWHACAEPTATISVGLRAVELDAAAAAGLGLPSAGSHAQLWVRDGGCGMDAATLDRIFEPFFTTKPNGQGTGLGLAVVHGIVKSHQGAIKVTSQPGFGSRFDLYLPRDLSDHALPVAPNDATAGGSPQGCGKRVLLIDDDEVMLLVTERVLQQAGYRVSSFLRPTEALAAAQAAPGGFDLAITDFNMPDISGLDVARALRQLQPPMPVMISSGHITDALRRDAESIGVRLLMHKECTFELVAELAHRAVAG